MASFLKTNGFLQGVARLNNSLLITGACGGVGATAIRSSRDLSLKTNIASVTQLTSQRRFSKKAKMVRRNDTC